MKSKIKLTARYYVFLLFGFAILHLLLSGKFWLWNLVSIIPASFFLLATLISLGIGLVIRKPVVLATSFITFLMLWPAYDIVLFNFPTNTVQTLTPTITVFNWNTEIWQSDDKAGFYDFLVSQKADVYHLQEAFNSSLELIDVTTELQEVFPDYHVVQSGDLVTVSKYPIEHTTSSDRYDLSQGYMRNDVLIEGRLVSLYNVHVPVPILPEAASRPITFLNTMHALQSARNRIFAELNQDLGKNTNAKIISGDFNTTKAQLEIWPLLNKYTVINDLANIHLPTSINFLGLSLWRIDWLLVDGNLHQTTYTKTTNPQWSDHDAVKFELSWLQ